MPILSAKSYLSSTTSFATRRRTPGSPVSRAGLGIAAAVSVLAHAAAALLIVVLAGYRRGPVEPAPMGAIELVMVQQKGSSKARSEASNPRPPDHAPARPAPALPPQGPTRAGAAADPSPRLPEKGKQPAPTTAAARSPAPDARPAAPPASPAPTVGKVEQPPAPAAPPVFDLAGNDSEFNAIVSGDHVLPATPDRRFTNNPPAYPLDAELHGQHGTVVLVIHVSEDGLTLGADVLETSGVPSLDNAALAAVRAWHFRPAVREGRTIPFDMPISFVFRPD